MTAADWRELIESYAAGRLSAASFKRRFLEAFETAATVPPAIQELYFTVEAYAGDPMGRGHDVTDDAALMVAARRALMRLAPPERASPAGAEPAIEEDEPQVRRAAILGRTITVSLRMGCALAALWLAFGVLQVFAIAEQIDRVSAFGPVLSTVGAVALTFVPVVGSVVAFFGAKDGWGWDLWLAGALFLLAPATVQILAALAWSRLRRRVSGRPRA
jgi:hypothetical protein